MRRISAIFGTLAVVLIFSAWSHKSDQYIRNRVVQIVGNNISCTGEQVKAPSGKDYILSAGHCMGIVTNNSITVKTEDGKTLQRAFIAEDPTSDLMLIEGLPGESGLDVAEHASRFEPVRSFTHGGRKPTYETDGVLVGEEVAKAEAELDEDHCKSLKYNFIVDPVFGDKMCILSVEETISTTQIVPGSSGGPLVNLTGDLVGVASMYGNSFSYWVKLSDIRAFLSGY